MEHFTNNSSAEHKIFACSFGKSRCNEQYRSAMYSSIVITSVFNTLLAVTAVLGNSLVFAAYYHSETLRKPVNMILLSLAATDFITGAVTQPLFIFENILIISNCTKVICVVNKLKVFFLLYVQGATLINISIITFDRYIAILHSYRYPELVTDNRVKKFLVGLWLVWTSFSILGVTYLEQTAIVAGVTVTSNVLFVFILYFKLFREIRRLETNAVASVNDPEEARKARERKTAKTIAIVLGLLFVCYGPLLIYLFVAMFLSSELTMVVRNKMFFVAATVLFSNSSLNVFVYYWRNEEMRSAMLKVIKKITQKCNSGDIP